MPPYNIDLDDSLRIGHKRIFRYKNTDFTLKLVHLSDAERDRIESAIRVLENFDDDPQYAWVKLCLERIVNHPYPRKTDNVLVERPENTIKIFPYHLKQYNDRWFLIGRQQSFDRISNFAIDRIVNVKISYIPCEESSINFQEYYDNVVGVSTNNEENLHTL